MSGVNGDDNIAVLICVPTRLSYFITTERFGKISKNILLTLCATIGFASSASLCSVFFVACCSDL